MMEEYLDCFTLIHMLESWWELRLCGSCNCRVENAEEYGETYRKCIEIECSFLRMFQIVFETYILLNVL